ncbi:MAG: glutathione S-transferase [Caulobacteraceae bacterium]|nr:MAG: glutathione S-transferase [Caulobacteraceae bacterium]
MIIVHHPNDSRSQRVLWLLEELGLSYEVKRYERNAKTRLAPPELKAIHPLGKSPVIQHGDVVVAETGAIIEYLLEAFPDAGLKPAAGTEAARQYSYWMHYAEGSAMTPLLLALIFGEIPKRTPFLARPVAKAIARKVGAAMIIPQIASHTKWWEGELGKTGWFAGERFSAADIMMSFPLEAAGSRAGFPDKPNCKAFLQKIHARPAYQAALKRGGPYAYA